jgi:hypothetical protein
MKKFIIVSVVLALLLTVGFVAYQNGLLSQYIPTMMNRFDRGRKKG